MSNYICIKTIRQSSAFRMWKGKEKVTAEFSLSALAYNIRRAINICGGVHNLIERYRRIAMPRIRKIAKI